MPKDPKRNVDRYKLAGGEINEFEFHQNQGEVKESATGAQATDRARAKTGGAKKSAKAVKGATAKKLAAKKGRKK